jgi:hypothetical protein
MTTYIVLLAGDENAWEGATAEQQAAVFEKHNEFARVLAERGHTVTGGAELPHSRTARTLRTGPDGALTVTEGPYAETVEQLGGYYLVESDDVDDLLDVCRILASGDQITGDALGAIEVRPVLDNEAG